jgi:hypothetical protein
MTVEQKLDAILRRLDQIEQRLSTLEEAKPKVRPHSPPRSQN